MRLGIKGKQVLGVTTIVGLVVVVLSLLHLARLARVRLDESRARAELLSNAIYHRAREVVSPDPGSYQALRSDPGMRAILESSLYSGSVIFAAITDTSDVVVAHADRGVEGQQLPAGADLDALVSQSSLSLLLDLYSDQGRNVEVRQPLLRDNADFGSIRIGISTLLIRTELDEALRPAAATALVALAIAVFGAMVLAQFLLRPIHLIRSGLTRFGRGEFDVRLDLDQQDEFGELGAFFNAASAQIVADRSQMADHVANLESAVERLEDAVAIVSPKGELLFANPAMRSVLPQALAGVVLSDLLPPDHALVRLSEETLTSRQSRGPVSAQFPAARGEHSDRLILTHPVSDAKGELVGVMLIVRNLEYLSQVQSTLRYSRKLTALGRLSAGVAHEVKNPLNAMMIHLELLRQQVAPRPTGVRALDRRGGVATADLRPDDAPDALQHVDVIAAEIRRLDQVVQGFLKFSKPDELELQPVPLGALFAEIVPVVRPEAERHGVTLEVSADGAPQVNGDPAMLRQAFLNLALNACQAMPHGGTLAIRCEAARGQRVSITVADTGVGIQPEHLQRIFDLYYTTKEGGSGIGLSMVYRTVQIHDGEIEVQSTPGQGTTFRVLLPKA